MNKQVLLIESDMQCLDFSYLFTVFIIQKLPLCNSFYHQCQPKKSVAIATRFIQIIHMNSTSCSINYLTLLESIASFEML